MNTKLKQSMISGIAGTSVMTAIMFVAPMMGIRVHIPSESKHREQSSERSDFWFCCICVCPDYNGRYGSHDGWNA